MFSAKNIVLLTEINGFFDASLLHNYMDVIVLCVKIVSKSYFPIELRGNIPLISFITSVLSIHLHPLLMVNNLC